MALQKSITFPNGNTGSYIMLSNYKVSKLVKEAAAHFVIYFDAAKRAAMPANPVDTIAQLNLSGNKFDLYFSGSEDIRAQFYAAAKVEPLFAGGGIANKDLSFADAADV